MPRAAQQLTNVEHIRRRSEIRQRFDHAWHFSHSAASTCKLSSDISHAGWSDRQRQKTKIKTQSKGNKMRAGGECFGEGLTGFYSAAVSPSSHPSHSFFQVLTPPSPSIFLTSSSPYCLHLLWHTHTPFWKPLCAHKSCHAALSLWYLFIFGISRITSLLPFPCSNFPSPRLFFTLSTSSPPLPPSLLCHGERLRCHSEWQAVIENPV